MTLTESPCLALMRSVCTAHGECSSVDAANLALLRRGRHTMYAIHSSMLRPLEREHGKEKKRPKVSTFNRTIRSGFPSFLRL